MRHVLGIALLVVLVSGGCRRKTPAPAPPPVASPPTAAVDEELLRLRNVALAYIDAELHEEAGKTLLELETLVPDEPMIPANRALVALREGGIDAAASLADAAVDAAPDDPDVLLIGARAAELAGRDDVAIERLKAAVAADPEHKPSRWALVELLRRMPPEPGVADDASIHLSRLLGSAPGNLVVNLALARRLLEAGQLDMAAHVFNRIATQLPDDPQARALLESARGHRDGDNGRAARASIIALDNVLKPTRIWQDALDAVKGPRVPVAPPVRRFIVTRVVEPPTGPRPLAVSFTAVPEMTLPDVRADRAVALTDAGMPPAVAIASSGGVTIVPPTPGDRSATWTPFPDASDAPVTAFVAADLDNDRRLDLVCGRADGSVWRVDPATPEVPPAPLLAGAAPVSSPPCLLLPLDADLDGDLDVLVGRRDAGPALLRNNGDGSFTESARELGLPTGAGSIVNAVVADFDDDGDPDLVTVDDAGRVGRLDNRRWQRYASADPGWDAGPVAALAAGDFDNDGWFDLFAVTSDGRCRLGRNTGDGRFDVVDVGAGAGAAEITVHPLDVDNDGWLDAFVLVGGSPHLFRNHGPAGFAVDTAAMPPDTFKARSVETVDFDSDGDLDLLAAFSSGRVGYHASSGAPEHGWQAVRLEAITEGGQRNNAFGVGGTVEVRAGRLYAKRIVRGPITHVGLGLSIPADTIRVTWPNGFPQIMIEPEPDQALLEKQMLKGSCPFLLAWDGTGYEFVTDLLWRSPVGMRINEQMVAPIDSTSDYVRIQSHQLAEKDGRYAMEITAALWETIFIDGLELWAVDHPPDVEIYADERFVAPRFPPFRVHAVRNLRPPLAATDHRGRDTLDAIAERDGRRLAGFRPGRFQGVAEEHWIELELGPEVGVGTVLLATGSIFPTDTSVNVAMGQAGVRPMPLALEYADGAGGWRPVIANAGFPAGKLKTMVLALPEAFPSADHRVRLRTNLEIYWDRIAVADAARDFEAKLLTLPMVAAELHAIGLPEMTSGDTPSPEIPDYSRPRHTPMWRDLHGWYTRHGDVAELLSAPDDRYVIMNAGDAVRLAFDPGPPPPAGVVRDFILFSDGWVKDGDLNTVDSMTVGPLPYHGMESYPYPPATLPETLRPGHPDWQRYHTRWVDSRSYRNRLR